MAERTCSIEGCDRPPKARGWCNRHYLRWQRHGDPLHPVYEQPVPVVVGDCLVWTGHVNNKGYGTLGSRYVHRLAWERAHGPIPPGMKVCHTCDNPPCVKVEHLFLGTQKDNMQDAAAKGRVFRPFKGYQRRTP